MNENTDPVRFTAESLDLLRYIDILLQRSRVIVICLLLALLTGILAILLTQPVYKATVLLHIEPDSMKVLGFDDLLNGETVDDQFYQTQFQLIQSRSLAQRVIERQGVLGQPGMLGPAEGASEESGIIRWLTSLPGRSFAALRRLAGTSPPAGQESDAASSQPVADPYEVAIRSLLGNMAVEPVRNTRLARISWSSTDPTTAASVANAITATFIEMNLEARYETAEQASQFLSLEIERLQAEIADLENRVQQAGTERDVASLSERLSSVQERMADLSGQHAEAQTERALKQMSLERLQTPDSPSPPEVISNPAVSRLKGELASLQQQYTEMSARFTDEWPAMQQLLGQMRDIEGRIESEEALIIGGLVDTARQEYEEALLRERSLRDLLDQQTAEAMDLSRDLAALGNTQLDLQNKQSLLETLLARRSETGVNARLQGMRTSNIRVVDEATVPTFPSHPNIPLYLVVSAGLGLLLGIGIALVQDRLDNTLKNAEDIEYQIRLPSLGLVPSLDSLTNGHRKGLGWGRSHAYEYSYTAGNGGYTAQISEDAHPELVSLEHPRSALAEAFRGLRTGVLLSRAGEPPKTIVMTSSEPREGKTTSAVNLAISLAQAGKVVLLVDADMRRPRLHKVLGVDGSHGLSHLLTGSSSVENSFRPTKVDRLWLLPSGPRPPNPAELLASKHMQDLIEGVSRAFNVVIFDTPPVMATVDPLIIGPLVDAVLLVVNGGVTPSPMVERTCRKIEQVNGNLIGVVLNNVLPEGSTYYGYRPVRDGGR
jgi:capsular exopolysaccharide synthesis family protein